MSLRRLQRLSLDVALGSLSLPLWLRTSRTGSLRWKVAEGEGEAGVSRGSPTGQGFLP